MTRGPVSREPPSPSDQTDQWSALTVPPSKVMPAFWHDGLQTRPRLTDYLELLIRRQRLCLLCAPAGYGKTVLMADLGRQCRLPQVWLRLTNEDRDPTGLAHSLRAAVDRVLADDVDGPGGRLWATAAADSRIQMAVLAHRLSRPPREWVLFLDDLQVLEGSGRAWVVLGDFLRSLAEHVHVVAASRLPLPGELLELFGAHRIATLGTAELSFTQDEAEAHLAAQAVPVADWDRRLELFELYEGWPAAVSLLLEPSVLTQAEGQDGVAQAKQLFERLAAQLVASLQAEERAFLERIAQLERITVPLCQECLTVGDAEAMLERLVRRNVLLDGPDQRGEYRLHRLFRQYVLASAGEKSSLPAEQHRRAASSLRAAGDLLGASRHLIAAGEHVQAEELLAEACQDLARAGQFRVMLDLLARWQTAAGRDLPARLAHWQAHAMYFVGDWRGAVAEASRALSDPTIDDAARASLLAIRSYARGKRGDVGGGLADIELVLAIGSGLAPRATIDSLRALAGQLANQLQLAAAQEKLEQALALARTDGLQRDEAMLLEELGGVRQLRGDLASAVRLGQQALDLATELGLAYGLAAACNNLATTYHALGRYDDAISALRRGKEIARQCSHLQLETVLWLSEGDLLLDFFRPDAAELCYSRATALAGAIGLAPEAAYAHLGLCHRHRLGGDFAASRRHLQDAVA